MTILAAYDIFLSIHNLLRWVLLLSGVLAIVFAIKGLAGKQAYGVMDNRWRLIYLIMNHSQLLIGLLLYFVWSPFTKTAMQDMGAAMKNEDLRFWAVEHLTAMVLAVIVTTIGNKRIKKAVNDAAKHRKTLIFFGISLLLILSMIPWDRPFFRF